MKNKNLLNVINSHITADRVDKAVNFTLKAIRLSLIVSTISILISLILRLIFGPITFDNSFGIYSTILWYSGLLTMWTLFISVPTLLIIYLYKRKTIQASWKVIKRELKLLCILTVTILVFAVIIITIEIMNV